MSAAFTSLSASSKTLSLGFGGTATLTSIGYTVGSFHNGSLTNFSLQYDWLQTAAATALQSGFTDQDFLILARGTVRVNASGTFIPQVTVSVGAAATVVLNSFFRIWPIGSNTVTNVGDWS
jgi:hypothetical protein